MCASTFISVYVDIGYKMNMDKNSVVIFVAFLFLGTIFIIYRLYFLS